MNTGDNAWVLASSALVLLMTPGLAMFYGGMTRSKNVLTTMMHSFFLMGLASLIWMLWGFSFAFAPDVFLGLTGGLHYLGLVAVGRDLWGGTTIPTSTYVIFQCGFAVLTPALISGAFAERMRFGAFIAFMAVWVTLVYCPICHWVWAQDGWLAKLGALDFAGGTVVHINAGMTALACVLLVGERKGYGEQAMLPHNLPITLLGAGLLWIGWFGFNAGSALKADQSASMAFLVTHLAAAAASVSWLASEWMLRGRPTTLGFASGAVAGLVSITPAAGYVNPVSAVLIGLVAGSLCYFAVLAKGFLAYDDSLDVVGIHAVGGAWGALATGLFATKAIGGVDGLLMGNAAQFFTQVVAVVATAAYSFLATGAILLVLDTLMHVRAHEDEERRGMDVSMHGESAYNL
ncbi:MAG: ammonium transporter [Thermodesulfobacteriota bacterium]